MIKNAIEFLRESNNIEGVWDDQSLEQAIYAWEYLVDKAEVSTNVILQTHKILMLHHLVGDAKGYFRRVPVWVGEHEGLEWKQIPSAMAQWCEVFGYNIKAQSKDSWKMSHVSFERIHPFVDGNGRLGRMLLNYQRHRLGLPLLVIKESEKQDYYNWFK